MATVTFDAREVRLMLSRLPEELRDKANAMAINKAIDKARTEMKRQITAVYNLKAAEVSGGLKISKASAKANVVSGSLFPTSLAGSKQGRAMNVIHFWEKSVTNADIKRRKKSDTLNELYFKFKKIGGKKNIPADGDKSKVFIGNKGRTVFRRTGKKRTPIEPVQVIGLPQMFNTAKLNQAVLDKAATDLLVETQRAVDEMLRRLNT
jgi:hypothetical protein